MTVIPHKAAVMLCTAACSVTTGLSEEERRTFLLKPANPAEAAAPIGGATSRANVVYRMSESLTVWCSSGGDCGSTALSALHWQHTLVAADLMGANPMAYTDKYRL